MILTAGEPMAAYLQSDRYIDFDEKSVKAKADEIAAASRSQEELIASAFRFVRDEVFHSWDARDRRVTVSASDVLRERVGICWAKSNLLAALLRANGVPSGICYQKLRFSKNPETNYCVHALNAVFFAGRWQRIDARGNKPGVNAAFIPGKEQLAFAVHPERGEIDYAEIHAAPSPKLMAVLQGGSDMLDIYLHRLPVSP